VLNLDGAKVTARAGDGCEIRASIMRTARPGAPRVLLIHALAMSWRQWRGVAAALPGEAEVAAIDCRGHGDSERRAGLYTVELMAADCIAMLDALGWDDAIVVGCSMGGCVAQAVAAGYPERVAALLLADTTADYGRAAEHTWRERGERAVRSGMAVHVGFQLTRWFTDAFRTAQPDIVADCLNVFLANDTACYAASCFMLGGTDLRPQLASIRCPASVIVGELDYATPPAMARDLADGIAGAQMIVIPGAKHFAPVERPEAIAHEITQLVALAHNFART
jgi:3-oxoadipate enol-lactonase